MGVLILLLMTLRVFTINCKGLHLSSKRVRLFNYIKNIKNNYIDICSVQETFAASNFVTKAWDCSGEGNLFGHMEVTGVEG